MTLDGMMTMAKADRYTEEGQKIIQDARRIYKVDEISETTGLQKQADGSWAPPKAGASKGAKNTAKAAGSSEKNAVGQEAESFMAKMKSEGWKNSGFDPAPGGRSFGVFSNGDKKIKVGVNAEGKIESVEEVKKEAAAKNTKKQPTGSGKSTKEKAGKENNQKNVNLDGKTPDEKRDIIHEKAKEANPKYAIKRWHGVDGKEHTKICEIKEAVGSGWQDDKEYKYFQDKETGNDFSADKAENAKINKDGFLEYQYKMESGNTMNIEFTNTPLVGAEKSKYQAPGVAGVPSSKALQSHMV